jgi:hypothetical protein
MKNLLFPRLLTVLAAAGFLASTAMGQTPNTVGTITFTPDAVVPGFTLIYPHNQANTKLINFCGEVVHEWVGDPSNRPGNSAYLLPSGDLIRTHRPASTAGNPIWAGGGGATIERLTWEGELVWSYTLNDAQGRFHHDIAIKPNGNVLAIAWEAYDSLACVEAGRNPELLTSAGLWSERIVELQPDGQGGATVVWEWKLWDQLIQDFDPTRANYGVVADHPEKVDINFGTPSVVPADWVHINSIDYNPLNDHILLSAPTFDEIWIIDRSLLSTGELKWRWGNPAAYQMGGPEDQKLFYEHDAKWIDAPFQMGSPHFGKIGVFNNDIPSDEGPYSALQVVNPIYDDYLNEYNFSNGTFEPADFDYTWTATPPQGMYSSGLSSFQPLGNGNTLVCVGRTGLITELTAQGDTAWAYRVPLQNGMPVAQGTQLASNANLTFRADRYPAGFPAFQGLDLSTGEVMELNPSPVPACVPCAVAIAVVTEPGAFAAVEVTGASGAVVVEWLGADGSVLHTGLEWTNPEPGALTVTVVATDALGCSTSLTLELLPNGVSEHEGAGWQVYPVPAHDRLTVQVPAAAGLRPWSLVQATGRVVAQGTFAPGQSRLDLDVQGLPAGTYWMVLEDANGRRARTVVLQ